MKYEVYGTSVCGYCTQAKRLLINQGMEYEYYDISKIDSDFQDDLMKIAGQRFRTVPQIFTVSEGNNRRYIGGFTELKEFLLS